VMQMVRGPGVWPLVNLTEAPMKTRYGMRTRPHFEIVKDEWREFAGGRLLPGPAPVVPQLTGNGGNGASFKPEKAAKDIDDAAARGKEGVAKYGEIKKVGKKVKPVTTEEELDDEIPI